MLVRIKTQFNRGDKVTLAGDNKVWEIAQVTVYPTTEGSGRVVYTLQTPVRIRPNGLIEYASLRNQEEGDLTISIDEEETHDINPNILF